MLGDATIQPVGFHQRGFRLVEVLDQVVYVAGLAQLVVLGRLVSASRRGGSGSRKRTGDWAVLASAVLMLN